MVITIDMAMAVTIIPSTPAPTQTIIMGARAVFGRAFNTTKKGSKILARVSDHHNIIAIIIPKVLQINKPIRVS